MPKLWPLKEVAMTNPFNAKPSDILMAAALVLLTLNAACSVIRFVNPELLQEKLIIPIKAEAPRE
jgi:hypothetical protein